MRRGVGGRQDAIQPLPRLATVVRTGHRAAWAAMLERPHAENRLAVFCQNRRRMALIDIWRAHGDDRLAEFFTGDIDDRQFVMARLHDFLRPRAVR